MKKEPVILFRKYGNEEEYEIAKKYFKVVDSRMLCKNNLVIAKYSCLPFYRELEKDLAYNNSELINTHNQHCYIADFAYYYDLKDFTPKSYDSDNFFFAPEGKYIVKGKTNSKKHLFKTHMFAENKKQAISIGRELLQDSMIQDQGVIYREFIPLHILKLDEISGIPFVNEWRFFYYRNTRLTYGYYWSSANEDTIKSAYINNTGLEFANKIANIAQEVVDYFVIDIAEKENGDWILIEMNDAQCAGPSENNMDVLYENLYKTLKENP